MRYVVLKQISCSNATNISTFLMFILQRCSQVDGATLYYPVKTAIFMSIQFGEVKSGQATEAGRSFVNWPASSRVDQCCRRLLSFY